MCAEVAYDYGKRQAITMQIGELPEDIQHVCRMKTSHMERFLQAQHPIVGHEWKVMTLQFRFYPNGRYSIPPHSDLESTLYSNSPKEIWVASESFGATRSMHWWVVKQTPTRQAGASISQRTTYALNHQCHLQMVQ